MSKYYKVNKCSMCYAFKSSSVPHYASDDCTKIAVSLTPSELKSLIELRTNAGFVYPDSSNGKLWKALRDFIHR